MSHPVPKHSLHNDVEIWRIIASVRELSDGSCNVSDDCPCDAPFCTGGTCRAFQCADCASPNETLDTDWSDIVPVEGNASLNYFRYDGNVGGVIVRTDWVSLETPMADDVYRRFDITIGRETGDEA